MKAELVAININAAPDTMPQKRLSFATADQWHDYARAMSRGQTRQDLDAANAPEVRP